MPRYRPKPGAFVEAIQFAPDQGNVDEVVAWAATVGNPQKVGFAAGEFDGRDVTVLRVYALNGVQYGGPGWWVVVGPGGDMVPMDPDSFDASYEPEPQ